MKKVNEQNLFIKAQEFAASYRDNIDKQSVFPKSEALDNLTFFNEPFPEKPCTGTEIVKQLHTYGSPATVAQTGGRYFGFDWCHAGKRILYSV